MVGSFGLVLFADKTLPRLASRAVIRLLLAIGTCYAAADDNRSASRGGRCADRLDRRDFANQVSGRVSARLPDIAVVSSLKKLRSGTLRLSLGYEGQAADASGFIILKMGHLYRRPILPAQTPARSRLLPRRRPGRVGAARRLRALLRRSWRRHGAPAPGICCSRT